MKTIKLSIGLFLVSFLGACEFCSFNEEVQLKTLYSDNIVDKPIFLEIIAEGANKPVVLQRGESLGDIFSKFSLPVNTNADSTRYIFKRENRTDTLTIRYSREFKMEGNDCGFNVNFGSNKVTKNTLEFSAYLRLGIINGGIFSSIRLQEITFSNP
jgi:hypothetical protein